MVRDPRAYLFDEPISALDALLRLEMRAELKRLQRDLGRTLVYVTHDQVEAMSMADRSPVLREGVIQQVRLAEDIYNRLPTGSWPRSSAAPPMNFLPVTASWDGGALELRHELMRVRTGASVPADLQGQLADGAAAWIGVRPEDIEIVAAGNGAVDATVYVTEPLGGETVVDLHLAERVLKVLAPATIAVERDQPVGHQARPQAPAPLRRGRRRADLGRRHGRLQRGGGAGPGLTPGAPALRRRPGGTRARRRAAATTPRCVPKW